MKPNDPAFDRALRADPALCKIVHQEDYRGWVISASLTRFGGLYVVAVLYDYATDAHDVKFAHYCDNVISARNFVDARA